MLKSDDKDNLILFKNMYIQYMTMKTELIEMDHPLGLCALYILYSTTVTRCRFLLIFYRQILFPPVATRASTYTSPKAAKCTKKSGRHAFFAS